MQPTPTDAPRHMLSSDVSAVGATWANVFGDDPFWSWVFPEASERPRQLARVLSFLLRTAMTHGHTYLAPGCAAAWVPPDVELLDWQEAADYASLLDEEIGAWSDTVLSAMTEMHALRPIDPHFYLLLVGTDPALRGQGRATHVLERVLRTCDAEGLPAYLESTNPNTAGIYRRLSFRPIGHHLLPSGPGIELLRRDPVAPAER